MFSFGNDLAGPQEYTHESCSNFGKRYIGLNQSLFAPFYFTLMPNFDIMMWLFIDISPKVILYQGALNDFVCAKNDSRGFPGTQPTGKQMINA